LHFEGQNVFELLVSRILSEFGHVNDNAASESGENEKPRCNGSGSRAGTLTVHAAQFQSPFAVIIKILASRLISC